MPWTLQDPVPGNHLAVISWQIILLIPFSFKFFAVGIK